MKEIKNQPPTSIGERIEKGVDDGGQPFEFFPPPEKVTSNIQSIGQAVYTSLRGKL